MQRERTIHKNGEAVRFIISVEGRAGNIAFTLPCGGDERNARLFHARLFQGTFLENHKALSYNAAVSKLPVSRRFRGKAAKRDYTHD